MDDPSSNLGAPYLAYPEIGSAHLHTRGQNFVAAMTSTLSPTLLNEFRFSYLPQVVDLEPFGLGTNYLQEANIKGFEETGRPGVTGSFPDFSWSGYSNMNGSAFDQRPKTQDLKVLEWTDNVTHIRGRHIFKGGIKIRRWMPHFTDSKQYQGVWAFNGFATQNPASAAGTGDAFADFMLGMPRQVTRSFPADTFGGQATYWHFYVQDDFKVSDRLTLNLGLRYELSPWASGYRGQVGTFDPSSTRPIIVASDNDQIDLAAQFAGPSAYALFQNYIQTSSQAGLPLSITATDKAQFGPRFGFAWSVTDKTVLRGGYGTFFEQENTDGRVNNNMVRSTTSEPPLHGGHRMNARRILGACLAGTALFWLAPSARSASGEAFPVKVQVDASTSRGELRPIWRFFGADEPNYAYMKDGRKLLAALGQLGTPQVYFRTHNLLNTGDGAPALKWGSTNAYTEDAQGRPVYDWTIVDRIFDTYLQRGLKPYAQIGFMPQALSVKPEPYQHEWRPGLPYNDVYTGWAYPPKDYRKWAELVYQWVKHSVLKYGRAEVEKWYWEVWNEANIGYWKGTPEEFHKLHDYAVDAVRRVLPTARVGGPDTAGRERSVPA